MSAGDPPDRSTAIGAGAGVVIALAVGATVYHVVSGDSSGASR